MTVEELMLRINQQGADQTSRSIRNVSGSVNDLNSNISRMSKITGGQALQSFGQTISNVGRNLKTVLTDNIVKLGISAVKSTMDFESGMTRVQAISGATGDDLSKLTDKAKQMGATTKFTATESAEAFKFMAMAGWKTEDMLDGIEGVMSLAAASGEDLALVSDIVTDSLTAFGLTAKDTGSYVDLLTNVANNSNTSIALLGESFKYAAPVMGAAKYSAEDTALALGLMANAGIKASQAGTTLRGAVTNLAKPTKQGAFWIDKLRLNTKDASGELLPFNDIMIQLREKFKDLTDEQKLNASASIFGKTSMSGMLAIINATDKDFAKLTKTVREYDGVANETAEKMMQNLSGQFKILQSTVEGLGIKIGEMLLPYIKIFVGWIQKLATWFSNLSPSIQKAIVVFLGLLAGIGPLLLIVGGLTTAIGGLVAAIGAIGAPAAIAIAAIGPLILSLIGIATAIGGALYKTGRLQEIFKKLKDIALPIFDSLKQKVSNAIESFKTKGAETFAQKITSGVNKVIEIIKKLITWGKPIKDMFMNTIANINFSQTIEAFEKLKTNIDPLISVLKVLGMIFLNVIAIHIGTAVGAINAMLTSFDSLIAVVLSFVGIVSNVFGIIIGIFTGDGEKIKKSVKGLIDSMIGYWKNLVFFVVGIVKGFVDGIVSVFKGLYDILVGHSIIPDLVNAIISWIKRLPSKVIDIFKNMVRGILNKVDDFRKAAKDVVDSMKEVFEKIAKDAIQWGKNIIDGLIKGIKGKIDDVKNMANNIAGAIKERIGWQSPTEKGPGADSDEWAPNLMNMFIKGIEKNLPDIKMSALKIASNIDLSSLKPNMDFGQPTSLNQLQPKEEFNMYGNITVDLNKIDDIEKVINTFKMIKSEKVSMQGGVY